MKTEAQFECRKSLICLVINTDKERKLRGNNIVVKSSNVITFSIIECIHLQSCFFSFFTLSSISMRNRFAFFSCIFLLIIIQVYTEDIYWSICASSVSCFVNMQPNFRTITRISLINKKQSAVANMFIFFRMEIILWSN